MITLNMPFHWQISKIYAGEFENSFFFTLGRADLDFTSLKLPQGDCFFIELEQKPQEHRPMIWDYLILKAVKLLLLSAYQSFKQQCCDRAVSSDCRKWCQETMSDPKLMLSLWGTMYLSCIQSPREVALSNCMTDG